MIEKTYHHGDLRTALIEASLRLLAERDVDELSLREVARAVGVSATAVYRHFPDKEALLATLAREGLSRLAQAQHAASEAAGGGEAGFNATGRAYIRFALANPALFRLTFASSPPADHSHADREVPEAMAFLLANAKALAPPGASKTAIRVAALQAWSLAHGLAMLMLDGLVATDEKTIDAVIGSKTVC